MNGVFLLFALALCLVALLFVLYPLLREPRTEAASGSAHIANRAVHRDRVRELDQDLAAGTLTHDQYALALADLERELLDSGALGADAPRSGEEPRRPYLARAAAYGCVAVLPFAAVGLYLAVGHADEVFATQASGEAAEAPPVSPEGRQREFQMLSQQLQGRLAEAPDDLESWVLLGQTQLYLDDLDAAERAFREAMRHGGDRDPDLLTRYADVLAERQGGLEGEPEALIEQALDIDPAHPQALWMAGTLAFQSEDRGAARQYWQQLLEVLPTDSREAEVIRDNLTQLSQTVGEG